MISDSGICSRREADKYIEDGRVSVNGNLPEPGQKVSEHDIVLLDDLLVTMSKQLLKEARAAGSAVVASKEKKEAPKATVAPKKKTTSTTPSVGGSKGLRPGKYVKYNKYAAARHAAKSKSKSHEENEDPFAMFDREAIKAALKPEFGKSLKRSAVAQRLAASPKSAALRKTSKNNPINKATRIDKRKR